MDGVVGGVSVRERAYEIPGSLVIFLDDSLEILKNVNLSSCIHIIGPGQQHQTVLCIWGCVGDGNYIVEVGSWLADAGDLCSVLCPFIIFIQLKRPCSPL